MVWYIQHQIDIPPIAVHNTKGTTISLSESEEQYSSIFVKDLFNDFLLLLDLSLMTDRHPDQFVLCLEYAMCI
jgi:hypothetical protein